MASCKTREEMEAGERAVLAPFAEPPAKHAKKWKPVSAPCSRPLRRSLATRAGGDIRSRAILFGRNFNGIARASFIHARFDEWNTKRRFS